MSQNREQKFHRLGWVVAAALAGVMLGSGFQPAESKIGVVNIAEVVEKSEFGRRSQEEFNAMKTAREAVLEFIDTYRVLTVEQATKFRDLSLKTNATAAEKAELDRLKAEVIAADRRSKELSIKTNLTPEERQLMQEYATRSQQMQELTQRWFREFTQQMQSWADAQRLQSLERARAAVQETARAQGFTVVFETGIAPFGANDLTEASLRAMNARR